jgi:hypothetical protein
MKLKLDQEFSALMRQCSRDHQSPRNRIGHKVGIPSDAGIFPRRCHDRRVSAGCRAVYGRLGFSVCWSRFQGKQPTFVSDKRGLIAGLLCWFHKIGVDAFELDAD